MEGKTPLRTFCVYANALVLELSRTNGCYCSHFTSPTDGFVNYLPVLCRVCGGVPCTRLMTALDIDEI